jgi:two-component system LytT family response regulator
MLGKSGVQLAEKLPASCIIVFVTAYDKYAVEAFELCAIDYLLKPFADDRFYNVLNKVRSLKTATRTETKRSCSG